MSTAEPQIERDKGDVARQLDLLCQRVTSITTAANAAEKRFAPVCTPMTRNEAEQPPSERSPQCEVASKIEGASDGLEEALETLNALIDSCDL